MEMIGNPQVFAIQLGWHPDPASYKPWMFGVFSVSVCGERLGSPTEEAVLNDILVDLHGWKKGTGRRCAAALMAADAMTAFLSIEEKVYGLEHLAGKIPPGFAPIPVPPLNPLEILGVDTLRDYRIYCVEDDATSRLLYARMGGLPRECRVPQPQTPRVSATRRADRRAQPDGRTARRMVRAVAGTARRALIGWNTERWK